MIRSTVVLIILLMLCGGASHGAERLHGTVVSVDRTHALLMVHHDPFGGMPAMTMTFRTDRASVARAHAGDTIDAFVDTTTDPWTLRRVRLQTPAKPLPAARPTAYLRIGEHVPRVPLIDQLGRSFTLGEASDAPTVISFIYTRCQDPWMCPLVSAKFRQLQDSNVAMRLLEITLDPAYDRPPVLRRYADIFGADPSRWRIATGDPAQVIDLAERFGIETREIAPGTIAHTEVLAVVDSRGRLASIIEGARWTRDDVIALVRASNDWGPLAIVRNSIRASLFRICGSQTAESVADRSAGIVLALVSTAPALGFLAWIVILARKQQKTA